jgi:DNA-binding beta-propeller fold protein YncE
MEVIKTVKVGQRPHGVTVSKDHEWLLICASDDNNVQLFDAKSMEYAKTLPSGPDPELFILHPSGNSLYLATDAR